MKRLLFPKHEAVDGLWSTIAQSVASGPLKDAGVFLTKVAPTPSSAGDFVSQSKGSADVDYPCNLSICSRYLRSRSGQEGLPHITLGTWDRAFSCKTGPVYFSGYRFESPHETPFVHLATDGSD